MIMCFSSVSFFHMQLLDVGSGISGDLDLDRVASSGGDHDAGRRDTGVECLQGSDSSDVPWKLRWVKRKVRSETTGKFQGQWLEPSP